MTYQEFQKRYQYHPVNDRIGKGGFGVVFKAYDTYLDRYVALKMSEVADENDSTRLANEVKLAAKLPVHPNIAHYEECYTFTTSTGMYDFGVLQFYNDGSLDDLIKKNVLTTDEKISILKQILNGIGFLHSNRIVHRDLKPRNILIARRGEKYIPKITDFGISKEFDAANSAAFGNSMVGAGTLAYSSPEQLSERSMHRNTDLWSYGVIAYQLFTGELPFTTGSYSVTSSDGRMELFRQVNSGVLPEAVNTIPEPWQGAIRRLLVVDPMVRFRGCTAVKDYIVSGKEQEVQSPASSADAEEEDLQETRREISAEPVAKKEVDTPAKKATTPYTEANNKAADDGTLPANSPISSDEPRLDNNRNQVGGDSTIIAPKTAPASQVSNTHEEDDDDDEPKRKLKWVWAAVAAVVLGIVGYIVVGGQGDSRPTNEDQISQETYNAQNGPKEYVDLGLPSGLKWATCNIGAYSPEEYGNYYAWGETSTKSEYTKENCQTFGENLGDISGDARYDAARANWGGSWRMPTKAEFDELEEYCDWQWTTQNGVKGYKVTGKNGNSIFLPAAGFNESQCDAGEFGDYWSSTPKEDDTNGAFNLLFNSRDHHTYWGYRESGFTVRPVFDGNGESEMTATTTTAAREAEEDEEEARRQAEAEAARQAQAEAERQAEARRQAATRGTIAGHEWVDLGLPSGLKWATCNIGAYSPEGYGNYYAWGETSTKSEYYSSNSKTYGQNLGDISGNAQYDAARANWGGSWRMPRKADVDELRNHCAWQRTTQNGVEGMRVTGKNGNSIFLPAASSKYESSRHGAGELGSYWSSTPVEDDTDDAYCLYFDSGHGTAWNDRFCGFTVRPVSN